MNRTERLAHRAARRARRRHVRELAAANRLTASLRRGRSIATHLIAAGVDTETAKGAANGLRAVAKRIGMEPVKIARTHRTVEGSGNRLRPVQHFTAAQVAILRAAYKPRKAEYKAAMALLALAA